MLIGHLLPLEMISRLDTKRIDELTEIALNEFVENPTIDEQIRQNPVIMKELGAVISRSLNLDERKK
jgi:hypothetical protein